MGGQRMIDHKYAYPPNIDRIEAAFHTMHMPVIYAYGGVIYNPHEVHLFQFLVEHEAVHMARQGDDPDAWWDRYLKDEEFRYDEELWAHVREWEYRRKGKDGKRYTKDALLNETARRLVAPFYQYKMKTLAQARADLLARSA